MLRTGTSLVELLVGIVILGILGGAATNALTQQGRVRSRVVARLAGEAQLREAIAPMIMDIAGASPAARDFVEGVATDTTLELRVTATEAYACGIDAADSVSFFAATPSPVRGRDIAPGDSAWSYGDGRWAASAVTHVAVARSAPDTCQSEFSGWGAPVRVTLAERVVTERGVALRFTRRARYSLYRAGDGRTYLGLREWSQALRAFAGQQPVAGPLDPRASRFQYSDSLGSPLTPPDVRNARLASVTLDLTAFHAAMPGAGQTPAPRLTATVALRNRR